MKRGYDENCEKTIEILEGRIDLVIYNTKGDSFYYYRFIPELMLSEDASKEITRELYLVQRHQVEKFLARHGKTYNGFLDELWNRAIAKSMPEKYDM